MDRSELMQEASDEAELNVKIEEISQLDEVTPEVLREAFGDRVEGKTDEELLQLWKETIAEEPAQQAKQGEETPADQPVVVPEGYKLYNEQGEEVKDLRNVTVIDLLNGKYQFGYAALDKEQRKALKDVFRVASLGHLNEQRIGRSREELATLARQLQETQGKLSERQNAEKIWQKALTAFSQGNPQPMQQLAQAYMNSLLGGEIETQPGASNEDAELERAGQQYFYEKIRPQTDDIARQYGVNAEDVSNAFMEIIDKEPFLTEQKVQEILKYDLPMMIEGAGYSRSGSTTVATSSAPNTELAQVLEQVKNLSAELAALKGNTSLAAKKSKLANAPGATTVTKAGTEDSEDAIPAEATASKNSFKDFLRRR
jgi:hypothetical protein